MNTINKIPPPALKICGLTRAEDVLACERYGIDFIGFNFFRGSKRWIAPEAAKSLIANCSRCQAVGVFVNHPFEDLVAICNALPELAVVQLHGSESITFARRVRAATGKRVWKAVSVLSPEDVRQGDEWADSTDLVLLDGSQPGSGREFEWQWLSNYQPRGMWGLAGGIRTTNIAQAVACRPDLVDVASGAETAVGKKDAMLIAQFAKAISEARNDG